MEEGKSMIFIAPTSFVFSSLIKQMKKKKKIRKRKEEKGKKKMKKSWKKKGGDRGGKEEEQEEEKLEKEKGRKGRSRAVGYQVRDPGFESQSGPNQFFIAPPCPHSTKWVARSLNTRRK
ncbi:fatty acid-binding protein 1 [Plakobranchus ocellatus]|uniref:Fatty acid-binding protein 1 n=1 Tax=Plakobranchus ocellatus TaxID=259542 RepID=A0AAV3YHX1_9GAST|nr:fatty acid-binding protein 1 [Plakobranchus ocellatus]